MSLLSRVWLRIPPGAEAKNVLTTGLERGVDTFVADADDVADLRGLGKLRLLTLDKDGLAEDGRALGPRVEIASVADQERALALAGKHDAVLVAARDWKVIPYENLIAAYQTTDTTLAVEAGSVSEVLLLLETLEVGVDAALFAPASAGDVLALVEALASKGAAEVPLARARVTRVSPVASGDRVCVDTASLLHPGEGLLVGSSSSALALVHAETIESGYVAARPFRVNAGPVHAYVLLPSGKTKYLSELESGDEVLAVDARGRARAVLVGRVKIETRPLLLVAAEAGGRSFTTLVQNAETIRLVTGEGVAVSVVDLEPGDEFLVRLESGGRHFGTSVRETVTER